MVLEFEKIFHPYLLENKKRYAGMKYDEEDLKCKGIDAKGIETERKDTLPFVKDIMHDVLDALLCQKDRPSGFQIS